MEESLQYVLPGQDKKPREARKWTERFLKNESTGGVLLLICTVIALVFANVPSLQPVLNIWHTNMALSIGDFVLDMTLEEFVNDALMAIFFFTVGLEIKREMAVGQLSSVKKATLPVLAALGGMIFPALIFTIFNHGDPNTSHGWGVPMATDIAFAVGILAILGKKAPLGVKILLTAIAIADDLGSIIVLAIFYPSHAIQFGYLLAGLIVFAVLFLIGRSGFNRAWLTIFGGIILWYLIYRSGVHATIAGVLLAVTVPYKTKMSDDSFVARGVQTLDNYLAHTIPGMHSLGNKEQMEILEMMSRHIKDINPLMHRFESLLSPIVNFFIMPIFALANAAVVLNMDFSAPGVTGLSLGVFFGLLFGKPLGIFAFSWLSVKCKIAAMPDGMNWIELLAMGVLGGIGFTMAIFIDNLAFTDAALIDTGKVAILITSATAAVVGYLIFAIGGKNMIKHENK